MRPKKVLFIESGVHEGGSFKSLEKHILALDQAVIKPVVIFFNENNLAKKLQDKGIKVFIVSDNVFSNGGKKSYRFGNAIFMKGLLRVGVINFLKILHRSSISEIVNISISEQIDFIHLNTELFRDRVGLLAADKLRIPVISHLRSKYQLGSIYFNGDYIKFANQTISKFIAVSNDTANFWISEVGVDQRKTGVLYDYHEPLTFKEKVRDYKRDSRIALVCVANLIPVKAHDFLLKSVAPLLKTYGANLLLVGKGEGVYTAKLKSLVTQLGLNQYVEFMGFRRDVPSILDRADIVLLLSKREGLPNILIEALGAGKIVVATDVGGIPEIIEHNKTGFLVTYGDEEGVRNIISRIISGEVDLETIKENARSIIQNKFSIDKYKKIIFSLYE